jgi:antitoxin (DNA-binding transcriptional repressor) of toxin-antitoxin stability system
MDETISYLKLERDGEPQAAARITLASRDLERGAWRVTVDGKPVAGLDALRPQGAADDELLSAPLSATQSAALAAAIRNGERLELAQGAKRSTVSLAGSSATLRWVDEQQKRAGTTSALVASGPKAATATPPAATLINAGPPASQSGLPAAPTKAVKASLGDCDDDIDSVGIEPIIARLSPGVILWGVACSRGAYNVVYSLLLSDEAGGRVRAVGLAGAGPKPVSDLMNVEFDPKTQTLHNFDKGRGLGDCGGENEWVWDGRAFLPSRQTLMPECRGVTADDWPTELRTRRR